MASDRRKLERIQEDFKDKQYSYEKLPAKADMSLLYNRRSQDIVIFMYKIKQNLSPQRFCSLFQLDSGSYYLQNGNLFNRDSPL